MAFRRRAVWLVSMLLSGLVSAQELSTNPAPEWKCASPMTATQVSNQTVSESSGNVERFQLLNSGAPETARIEALISPSLLHEDYTATITVNSTTTGARAGLIILLPHQSDPRTGKPMQIVLPGDQIRNVDKDETLQVKVTKKAVETLLRRSRAELNRSDIQTRDAVILGAAVIVEATPGETWVDLGAVEYGPIIPPRDKILETIQSLTTDSEASSVRRDFVQLDVELGAIMLDRKPVILRLMPDHQEHLQTLHDLRMNAIWVPDYQAADRARQLWQAGLAVLATPPHPEFEPGDYSQVLHSLPPLETQCPNVSAWYEGTRVAPSELDHLLGWSREVRSADRVLQRLQMADVTGAEGAVAREIDLVGIGRHVVGRDESFGAFRNLLLHRQKAAGQLSFPWTWIQIEPSATQLAWRQDGVLPFVEPEQIQHQVYAALSAGYRGLGFWKTRQLQIDDTLDRETTLAMELVNMEIELLEPFLARGRREGYLTLHTESHPAKSPRRNGSSLENAVNGASAGVTVTGLDAPEHHDAAIISSNGATLILATTWDRTSQFVPGPMFEREAGMIVAASETASAWQISTSGIRSQPRELTAGGLSIRIRNLDRSAALIVTSDTGIIRSLEQKIHSMSERSASKTIELAELKYLRVLETTEILRSEHSVPSGVDTLLSSARQQLDKAQFENKSHDFHEATLLARDAMRNLRQVQLLCWKDAVAELSAPTASPHTISFQTLPEHWRLMHYLDQQSFRMTENLLPSGSFEDKHTIQQGGWSRDVADRSLYSATADVISDGRTGRFLRLAAWRSDANSKTVARDDVTPLVVTSPAVDVRPGDVMIVKGRVRRGRAVTAASKQPMLLFDSELGPENALRMELETDWKSFEMIRPIRRSTEFHLSIALTGQAEIHLDDLEVLKIPVLTSSTPNARFTGQTVPAP